MKLSLSRSIRKQNKLQQKKSWARENQVNSVSDVRVDASKLIHSRDVSFRVMWSVIGVVKNKIQKSDFYLNEMESEKYFGNVSPRKISCTQFASLVLLVISILFADSTNALSLDHTKHICNHEHPKAHQVSLKSSRVIVCRPKIQFNSSPSLFLCNSIQTQEIVIKSDFDLEYVIRI